MYDFEVTRENSHWSIHMGVADLQSGLKGSVWIDPATSRVLRIEMEAKAFPEEFPPDHVESATDYQYIRLGDAKQYLLPVHAETLSCQRGTDYCSRNVDRFPQLPQVHRRIEHHVREVVPVPLEQYLTTSYDPDVEYVDADLVERNVELGRTAWSKVI